MDKSPTAVEAIAATKIISAGNEFSPRFKSSDLVARG
jgi:hypothetical protein